MPAAKPSSKPSSADARFEWLILAAVVTAAAATVPAWAAEWAHQSLPWLHAVWLDRQLSWNTFEGLFDLAFGLLLVLPHPVRAGLILPDLRRARWGVAAVCGGSVLLTLLFNRRLDMPQLRAGDGHDAGYWMWLIGPPAEDLVFAGFLYGKFAQLWPGPLARWLPVNRAAVLSAIYFSLWHAQNLQTMSATFVAQQMLYTLAAGVASGLVRQWTGSILLVTVTHMACNWIAWHDVGLRL